MARTHINRLIPFLNYHNVVYTPPNHEVPQKWRCRLTSSALNTARELYNLVKDVVDGLIAAMMLGVLVAHVILIIVPLNAIYRGEYWGGNIWNNIGMIGFALMLLVSTALTGYYLDRFMKFSWLCVARLGTWMMRSLGKAFPSQL